MQSKLLPILLIALLTWVQAFATQPKRFCNFVSDNTLVRCLFQDSEGGLWAGTSYGLGFFMGNETVLRPMTDKDGADVTGSVFCALPDGECAFYLGTDEGLRHYDWHTGIAGSLTGIAVRSMVRVDAGHLLLGTTEGLFIYDTASNVTERVKGMPPVPVDPVVGISDHLFMIAAYDGLYCYEPTVGKVRKIEPECGEMALPLSILPSHTSGQVWVGTERGLWKYDTVSGRLTKTEAFAGLGIKRMAYDAGGRLIMATDYGLCEYDPVTREQNTYLNRRTDPHSLSSNTVTALYNDRHGNLWAGTDCGLSVWSPGLPYKRMPWGSTFGTDEGNALRSVCRDSRGRFWLGGGNGLGMYDPAAGVSRWFKMGRPGSSLSHNVVRCIAATDGGRVYIGTDGGLNVWDDNSHAMYAVAVADSVTGRNANWTNGIYSDGKGRLLISAYCGGVFCVDESRLGPHAAGKKVYAPGICSDTEGGLQNDMVLQTALDASGRLVAVNGPKQLERVDFNTGKSHRMDLEGVLPGDAVVKSLFSDPSGCVMFATADEVRIVEEGFPVLFSLEKPYFEGDRITSACAAGDAVWFKTTKGLYRYDRKYARITDTGIRGRFMSVSVDNKTGDILLGERDNFTLVDARTAERPRQTVLRLVSVASGDRVLALEEGRVSLPAGQRDLKLAFAELPPMPGISNTYIYRVEGLDGEWRVMEHPWEGISLTDLPPGDFRLEVRPSPLTPRTGKDYAYTVGIHVPTPLRARWWVMALCAAAVLLPSVFAARHIAARKRSIAACVTETPANEDVPDVPAKEETGSGADGFDTGDDKTFVFLTGIIEAHIGDMDFNVSKLSELSGLNSKAIYRKVKQCTGLTAVGYIRELRLRKATSLLRERGSQVSDAMYGSGFADASYFSKCFTERFGVTPSEYRKAGKRTESAVREPDV